MDIKNPYLKIVADRLQAYGVSPVVSREFAYPAPRGEGRGMPCETLWYYVYEVPYFAIEALALSSTFHFIELAKRIVSEANWPLVIFADAGVGTLHNATDVVSSECFGTAADERYDVNLVTDKGVTVREFPCGCTATRADGEPLWNHQRNRECSLPHVPK
jgi:hypothetical protein